jgi:hypothetical protein
MKNKLNSYLSILAITCAVAVPLLSANAHELPVQASLTAPASYDIGFNGISYTGINGASPTSVALFERTADGVYYNYYHRFRDTRLNPNHTLPAGHGMHSLSTYNLPTGLDITMEFNRSNTDWTIATPYNGYYNTDTKIGSNNSVGSISNKIYLNFNNQTNKNYYLYLDVSSTAANRYANYRIDNLLVGGIFDQLLLAGSNNLNRLYIPSYSSIILNYNSSSDQLYFDAWYLKDLGVSASYDAGYEVGEDDGYQDGLNNNPNVLINAAESLIGMFVNFIFIIFSLEIFGISILSIVGVLFGIVAIVWILKTIRG